MQGTYDRLMVHVRDSDFTVIKAASRKIKRKYRYTREHRADRHKFYREMLRLHHDWQKLCDYWRM